MEGPVVDGPTWRRSFLRAVRFCRRLESDPEDTPTPPPLPPARVVNVPGRGEMFLREAVSSSEAPPILLLHGWAVSSDLTWWRLYESAGGLGHVLALDHRGHGRGIRMEKTFSLEDAADDAAALLEELGIGPVIVCGYSMGGPVSLQLWKRHPELVAGLVLEATALEWRVGSWERIVWKVMGRAERVLRSAAYRGVVERSLRDVIETCPKITPFKGWFKGELRRGDVTALDDAGHALARARLQSFAGSVDVPTAVVITAGDHLVRPKKQRALAAAIPGARTFQLGAGHLAPIAVPDEFAAVTIEALRSVGAGSSAD